MARKVIVVLEDDLDGTPADESLRFAFDGPEYEIDLSGTNAARFREQLTPFIEHARKAGRGQDRQLARAAGNRQRSGQARAWAKAHGIAIIERGRIPATFVEQYQAASKDADAPDQQGLLRHPAGSGGLRAREGSPAGS